MAVAIVAALLVALRLVIFGSGFHEPTSQDRVGALVFSVDGTQGELTLKFDQTTGWTIVTDSRLPDLALFVRGSEVTVQTRGQEPLVSLPSSALFPSVLSFAPSVLAASLDRGPRECTLASPNEQALLDYFFGQPETSGPTGIRGRTTFVDQTGNCPAHAADSTPERLALPDVDGAIPATTMADGGATFESQLIDSLSLVWTLPDRSSSA